MRVSASIVTTKAFENTHVSVIVTLTSHPGRLARIRSAARDSHTVIACDSWEQIFSTCRDRMVHAAVLDLETAASPSFDSIRRFKRMNPTVVLIGYTTCTLERVHHIFDAGRYGFEALVIADIDDGPSAFARAIERASARGVAGMVRNNLAPAVDPMATDALLTAITRAHERLTPAGLAQEMGVGGRRLSRALAASGNPRARRCDSGFRPAPRRNCGEPRVFGPVAPRVPERLIRPRYGCANSFWFTSVSRFIL